MKVQDRDTGHVLETSNEQLCEIWRANPEKYVPVVMAAKKEPVKGK